MFFGVLVALNIQTSFLTPPMAMSCYYLKGVAPKHVTLNQIFAGALPFLFMVFVTMFLVYVFPQIAMWLPNHDLQPRQRVAKHDRGSDADGAASTLRANHRRE